MDAGPPTYPAALAECGEVAEVLPEGHRGPERRGGWRCLGFSVSGSLDPAGVEVAAGWFVRVAVAHAFHLHGAVVVFVRAEDMRGIGFAVLDGGIPRVWQGYSHCCFPISWVMR